MDRSWVVLCLALLAMGLVPGRRADDEDIQAVVEMVELDYQDQCNQMAEADWALLNNRKNALEEKVEADKTFGDFAKKQVIEVKTYIGQANDVLLRRKLDLISTPGDTLLDTDQWNNLVSYSDEGIYRLQSAKNIDCRRDPPQSCSYSDFLTVLATSKDRHLLASAQSSWESNFPDEKKYATEILPSLRNASSANGANDVEEYWETLAEYPGGYSKVQELWEELEPLYLKLEKYIALKLQQSNGSREDGSIPSHWLGSPFGEDWSYIIESILPEHSVLKEINKNLKYKFIIGRNVFKAASTLLSRLGLEDLKETFWRNSAFDKTCPTRLVDYCGGGVQVFTCNDISINQLLEAHEAVLKAKHAESKLRFRSNSFIIRQANRYSALDVAISELGSLLALDPHQLSVEGVLPLKSPDPASGPSNKVVLQLLLAMRDLPRLAYYLAADKWRLKLLESAGPIHIGSSWAQTRRDISKVSPSDKGYLGDVNILSNKPYIGNFLGILLKYQIYSSLTEEMFDPEADIVKHISDHSLKLKEMMTKGFSQEWTEVVKDSINIKDIKAESLVDYYQPLATFLNTELEEDSDDKDDDDDDAPVYVDEDEIIPEEDNEADKTHDYENIADSSEDKNMVETEISTEKEHKLSEKIHENTIGKGDVTEKNEDNPFLIPKENDASPAASSSDSLGRQSGSAAEAPTESKIPYVWIALGVFILIIVVLAIVIGRKRYKHKKELERKRRDGTA